MSRSRLYLRISAGVLGALIALSPPAGAGNSAAAVIAQLKTRSMDSAVPAAGHKRLRGHSSGFVTIATTDLDLSKFDAADFGDESR